MHISELPPPPTSLVGHVMRFFERFGHMMSRIILSALYFILVAPPGIVYALLLDPLRIKKRPVSNWVPFKTSNINIQAARRQA
ncbi:MAG: hypothetical protein HY286_06065 [Planctomycetes bacterium]|nr:hypothetical protein [Planctomycetota bacterium]